MDKKSLDEDKERRLDSFIKNASLVSQIPLGYKLGAKTRRYYNAYSWWDSFSRYNHNESRVDTVNFIYGVFKEGKDICIENKEDEKEVKDNLFKMITGVSHLIDVYKVETNPNPDTITSLSRVSDKIRNFCDKGSKSRNNSSNSQAEEPEE